MTELLSITVQGPQGRLTYRKSRRGVRIKASGTPPRGALARIAQTVSDLAEAEVDVQSVAQAMGCRTSPATRAAWEVLDA